VYFSEATRHPFHARARDFDLVNAWWLIEAATLAYSDPEFVLRRFDRIGWDVRALSRNHTVCYVASNAEAAIVAFRGTESRGLLEGSLKADFTNVVADVRTDAALRLVESGQGGRVHRGFKEALDHVWPDLTAHLNALSRKGLPLWFTGHSLGAALATLAADRFGNVAGLYTFGSPRVGDASFRDDFRVPAYRFLHNNDIVGRVPLPPLYAHVGELKYIDNRGRIRDNPSVWERIADAGVGDATPHLSADGHPGFGFLPDVIRDHVPVLYAIHILNNLP
jgi:hypothetical protein